MVLCAPLSLYFTFVVALLQPSFYSLTVLVVVVYACPERRKPRSIYKKCQVISQSMKSDKQDVFGRPKSIGWWQDALHIILGAVLLFGGLFALVLEVLEALVVLFHILLAITVLHESIIFLNVDVDLFLCDFCVERSFVFAWTRACRSS